MQHVSQLSGHHSRANWILLIEGRHWVLFEYILAIAKLPHHPDGMILHTSNKPGENNQPHVTIVEENSEGLRIGRNYALGHRILRQGLQHTVDITDTRDSP